MELRLYDLRLLGPGSRVVCAAEVQWDQVRDTTALGVVQVRTPLHFGRSSRRNMSPIERRMVDRIVRDIDIVSVSGETPIVDEPAIDHMTEMPFGLVTIVDANTVDVSGTVADAGDNSTVVFDGSQGPIEPGGTVFAQLGQQILGGGQTIMVEGTDSGALASLNVQGTPPTIIGGQDDVFAIGHDSTLRALSISGGQNGIFIGQGMTGFSIIDNDISGAASHGVYAAGDVDGTITGNTVSLSGETGFQIDGNVNGIFADNAASENGGSGFDVDGDAHGIFTGNTANLNQGSGFEIDGNVNSSFVNNTPGRAVRRTS